MCGQATLPGESVTHGGSPYLTQRCRRHWLAQLENGTWRTWPPSPRRPDQKPLCQLSWPTRYFPRLGSGPLLHPGGSLPLLNGEVGPPLHPCYGLHFLAGIVVGPHLHPGEVSPPLFPGEVCPPPSPLWWSTPPPWWWSTSPPW